jgi:glycosyltransferase 2 family protein
MTGLSDLLQSVKSLLRHRGFHLVVSLLLAALFLFLAFRGTDFGKLLVAVENANYWWILLSFSVMISSHILRAWRWRFLLAPIKPDIGLRNLFSGVMIGYFMNNIFPRAGEIARPYTTARLEKMSAAAALGTIVVERILDTMVFVFMVFVIPLLYTGPLLENFPWLRNAGLVILLVILPFMLFPVVLMIRRDWTDTLLSIVCRFLPGRLAHKVQQITHSFLDGFLFVKRPAVAVQILVMTGAIWALYFFSMYLAFYAFGLQTQLGLRAAWVIQAISSIGVAIPTPGSTGTYHAFTSQAMSRLFSIDKEVALSFATVTHAVNFIGVTIIGLYFFMQDNMSISEALRGEAGEKA